MQRLLYFLPTSSALRRSWWFFLLAALRMRAFSYCALNVVGAQFPSVGGNAQPKRGTCTYGQAYSKGQRPSATPTTPLTVAHADCNHIYAADFFIAVPAGSTGLL